MQKFQFPHMGPYPAEIQVCKMTTEDQDVSFFFWLLGSYQVKACITYKKKPTHTHFGRGKALREIHFPLFLLLSLWHVLSLGF